MVCYDVVEVREMEREREREKETKGGEIERERSRDITRDMEIWRYRERRWEDRIGTVTG